MEFKPTANQIAVWVDIGDQTSTGLARAAMRSGTQHEAVIRTLDVLRELEHRGWSTPASREMVRRVMDS